MNLSGLKSFFSRKSDSDADEETGEWQRRRTALVIAVPSILTVLILGGLVIRAKTTEAAIQLQYRNAGREAYSAGDRDKATFYYSRLVGEGDLSSPEDELNWASMLASSGDSEGAMKLLDKLAPEKSSGFAPAHRQKAMLVIAALQSGQAKTGDVLNRLNWHLKQGVRDDSVQGHQLWAFYYVAAGQLDEAIGRRVQAAQLNPDLWLEAAAICDAEHVEDRTRFLGRAESHARQSLRVDPLDTDRRLMLARILVDRLDYDAAQKVLDEGLTLADSPPIRRACSDLYLVRLAQMRTARSKENASDDSMREEIRLIGLASGLDPQNPAVFQYWANVHNETESEQQRTQIREQLEKSIVAGESAPFAHFTLGGLLWTVNEPKKSLFHLEKAFELDPRFTDAANNLAWVLARQEKPELERAEQLIRQALEKRPTDIRYLDTLGEVLSKKGEWDEALVALEKVFPASSGGKRKELHQRLAVIYENLGEESLASMHRQSAAAR